MVQPYNHLCVFDSFKGEVREKEIELSTNFLNRKNISTEIASKRIDRELWDTSRNQPESVDALLCLRCRASHPINAQVNSLYKKHRAYYEIELQGMLVCVLDDNGSRFFKIPKEQFGQKIKYINKPLNWENLSELPGEEIRPFSAEVIYSFNPTLSKLDTWTSHKVKSNASLKKYFRSYGLLLISPWANIANSSPSRVREAWMRCGAGSMDVSEVERLHQSYLLHYRSAKQRYRAQKGRNYKWVPDEKFLRSLDPPQSNLENLEFIDTAIRQYLAGVNNPQNFIDEKAKWEERLLIEDASDSKELIQIIQTSLKRSAIAVLKIVIDKDRPQWQKDSSRKLAWQLFGQGMGQRDIAKRCQHKQGWVSKLLQEKTLATSIAQEAAIELVKKERFQTIRNDPNGVDRMIEQLSIFLTSIQEENGISPLREWTNEVLNQ